MAAVSEGQGRAGGHSVQVHLRPGPVASSDRTGGPPVTHREVAHRGEGGLGLRPVFSGYRDSPEAAELPPGGLEDGSGGREWAAGPSQSDQGETQRPSLAWVSSLPKAGTPQQLRADAGAF